MAKEKQQRHEQLKLKQRLIDKWHTRILKAGITQKELAEKSGVDKQQISNILRGHTKNPRCETVNKIEVGFEALGIK